MPPDPGLLALMRDDLSDLSDIREVRMFGGVCFMLRGHMLCGIHRTGALYRVGKPRYIAALAIPGAAPMAMAGRQMRGIVEVPSETLADDTSRAKWLDLCLQNVASLPPK